MKKSFFSLKCLAFCFLVVFIAFSFVSCGEKDNKEPYKELIGASLTMGESDAKDEITARVEAYLTASKEGNLKGITASFSSGIRRILELYDIFYTPISKIDGMEGVASRISKETTDFLVFINDTARWEIKSIKLGDKAAEVGVEIYNSDGEMRAMKYEMVYEKKDGWYIKNLKRIDSVKKEIIGIELTEEEKKDKELIEARIDSFLTAATDGDFDTELDNYDPMQSLVIFASMKAAGMGINALITTTTGAIIPVGSLAVNELADFSNSFSDIINWEIKSILLGEGDAEVCVMQRDSLGEETYVWYGLMKDDGNWYIDAFYVVAVGENH